MDGFVFFFEIKHLLIVQAKRHHEMSLPESQSSVCAQLLVLFIASKEATS